MNFNNLLDASIDVFEKETQNEANELEKMLEHCEELQQRYDDLFIKLGVDPETFLNDSNKFIEDNPKICENAMRSLKELYEETELLIGSSKSKINNSMNKSSSLDYFNRKNT